MASILVHGGPSVIWDEIRQQTRNFFEALHAKRKFEPIPVPYTYVDADVTIDGHRFTDVGIRKKG